MCKLKERSLTSHIQEAEKHAAKKTQSQQKELQKITAVTEQEIKTTTENKWLDKVGLSKY